MNSTKLMLTFLALYLGGALPLCAQKKVLIVITNNQEVNATIGDRDTVIAGGYELSEVSEAYQVFTESGLEVDFMSPTGGKTYAEPEEEVKAVNQAFLAIPNIQSRLDHTLAPTDVQAADYRAIYFAGGKTMWDFPDHEALAALTAKIYEQNGVVGAVCHGPAALVNVRLSNGSLLIKGKKVSGFTNREEQLFSKTGKFLPFLLQDKLSAQGADFQEAPPMFDQVVVDQRLVTGQNPLSTYSVAEEMVKLLGKTPPARTWTDLSYTIGLIQAVVLEDKTEAQQLMKAQAAKHTIDQELFQNYGIYAFNGYLGEVAKSKGLDLLEFAAEMFPENAKSHEALAKAYHQGGDRKRAMVAVEKSLSIDPNSESAQALKKEIGE